MRNDRCLPLKSSLIDPQFGFDDSMKKFLDQKPFGLKQKQQYQTYHHQYPNKKALVAHGTTRKMAYSHKIVFMEICSKLSLFATKSSSVVDIDWKAMVFVAN